MSTGSTASLESPRTRAPADAEERAAGWRLIARTMGGERYLAGAAVLSGIGWQLVIVGIPIVLGWTVEHGIEGQNRDAVWIGGLLILLLGIAEAACDASRHWLENAASTRAAARLREEVVEASLRFREDDRDAFPPGDLVARGTSDVDTVADLLDGLGYSVGYALTVPVVLAIMTVIDPLLGLVTLVTTVIVGVVVWRSSRVWERRGNAYQEAVGGTVAGALEILDGFKTIRGLGSERAALRRFTVRSDELRDAGRSVTSLWTVFEPLLDVLSVLSVVGVLWIGGEAAVAGTIGLGDVVTAFGLALVLVIPVRVVGEWVVYAQVGIASARRLAGVVDRPVSANHAPVRKVERTDGLRLALQSVEFSYGTRPRAVALRARELRLDSGDVALVRGAVGSGKSTLLTLLAGHRQPTTGAATLNGTALAEWPADELRRRVLLLTQRPLVLSGTVADNLLIAAPTARREELLEAIAFAQADEFVAELPQGIDTELGPRGQTLSGGQRQRLALARAALARPDVLLLDGALSSVEPASEAALLRRICSDWPHGLVVVVTALPDAEAMATTIVDLDDGRVTVSRR